ncbi:MAG: DUF1800 domain-containing protein [Bacteroidota bacterium]|nr:DUF1800 domain-containing protein [Bacteroidota bacterium]MDP4230060.1 DUF1800 domain-containing protein [Bacteroidota bacterium]MDP4237522.1 DUF1800 domain-containing protein [Bacteroidota bacterium]
MDRRSFLTAWAQRPGITAYNHSPAFGSHERTLSTGLEPWVPSVAEPWDAVRQGHLLRRTMMLPKWTEIDTISSLTPSAAVDLLLNTASDPAPPSQANHETTSLKGLDSPLANALKATWASDDAELKDWFANVLLNSPLSIIEKMTFFWSGHFTSQFVADESYVIAPLLYRQNQLFRNNGLSNFQSLAFDVTLDGAMLVYLGGILNTKSRANENYARELMELFTMGLGNYSEGDVKEAARILTGWRVAQFSDEATPNGIFNTYFSPADHDEGNKTYLGVSFSAIVDADNTEFLVKKNEIQKLIDTIFTYRKQAVATFICRKIYKFFVYSNPEGTDETVIAAMAQLFMDNNFEIKPVISALLKSAHFFDNANIGCQIKTPAEYIIGIARQLGYKTSMAANMTTILQELFNPPNVSGWTGWHDWITTNTYPVRSTVVTTAIGAMTDQNVLDFIGQFPNNDDANKLITSLGALMLPRKLAQARHDDLVSRLVSGGKDYEWPSILSTSPSTAARNMRDVLTTICNLPDYQLC